MSKEERYEIRECSRNNNTKSKYIYDNKENNSISFDKQTIINLLNKQDKQLAELKAECEKLKQLKILEDTNCTFDEFKKTLIKDEEISNEKALKQINIDNEILRQQLKSNTKQVCEKIRTEGKAISDETIKLPHKIIQVLGYFVSLELLTKIEEGENNV